MYQFPLNRLLKTCIANDGLDLWLIDDCAPLIRTPTTIQMMAVPRLRTDDLQSLIGTVAPTSARDAFASGERSQFDLSYGSEEVFRVTILGPKAVNLMRMSRRKDRRGRSQRRPRSTAK